MTTYYLEMTSASALKEKGDLGGLQVQECEHKSFRYNKFLYQLVGATWSWSDKLSWSDEQWMEHAEKDNFRTWVAYYKGSPAGYYELQKQTSGNVEIEYFGLAPGFIGKGYGRWITRTPCRTTKPAEWKSIE